MEEFFDNVVVFLEEYYVYVIGVGLIIILMLVGLIASRNKARKEKTRNEGMANINNIDTGSINDIPSNVNNSNGNDVIEPVDVVSLSEENNHANEPVANANSVEPQVNAPIVNDFNNPSEIKSEEVKEENPTEAKIVSEPTFQEYKPIEEVKPIEPLDFDKTEILDISEINPSNLTNTSKPTEVKPTFITDQSQFNNSDDILNGIDSSRNE